MDHKKFFSRAIRLAQSVKGTTSPNPAVGCVIVKKNRVLSTGATRIAGCDHAEAVALKKAGASARNASLYVTLEPCVDYPGKKTPSCVSQIIRSGIKEVFIGMKDPNPRVNGRGIQQLRKAGIEVSILHEHKKEIQILNEDFFKFITTGLPFVYAKAAMTLDGNIANLDGDSQWISGEASRAWVHSLRNRVDAIMVGIGTVLKDNPQLNVRMVKRIKDPVRYIIDANGRTPPDSHVMNDGGKTVFIVRKGIPESFKDLCRKNGQEWLEFDAPEGHFRLKDVLERLGKEKCVESILVEGGGNLFHGLLAENAVDRLIVCVATKVLGGKGIQLFNGAVNRKISEALRLKDVSVENIGEDIFIQGTF
jgi:diaminohydroxyphosphoribosylaminopyrimidine deaminase / 5-amino-6-(5-phosphoribosylamino)uracil reductase